VEASCEHGSESSGAIKLVAEQLAASQKCLSAMSQFVSGVKIKLSLC
jgi:hypothetical protein